MKQCKKKVIDDDEILNSKWQSKHVQTRWMLKIWYASVTVCIMKLKREAPNRPPWFQSILVYAKKYSVLFMNSTCDSDILWTRNDSIRQATHSSNHADFTSSVHKLTPNISTKPLRTENRNPLYQNASKLTKHGKFFRDKQAF